MVVTRRLERCCCAGDDMDFVFFFSGGFSGSAGGRGEAFIVIVATEALGSIPTNALRVAIGADERRYRRPSSCTCASILAPQSLVNDARVRNWLGPAVGRLLGEGRPVAAIGSVWPICREALDR